MFARVTPVEIDTLRVSVEQATAVFRDEVLPELRRVPDFEGAVLLATPEGLGMIITLWASATAAAPDEAYATRIARHVTMFRSPPGREVYEVTLADVPAASRTA